LISDPSRTGPFGLPRSVLWGGAVFLAFIVFFAVGLSVGRRPVGDLTQRADRAETAAGDAEARADDLEARLHGQRALALLYQTMVDMDARNFGTANERLTEVVAALDRADRTRLGADAAELEAIRDELAALDIRVATDLAGQRATLSGLAQRLASALGEQARD
jgi:hypothetical protein